jgi:hypothetical protein
VILLLEPVLNPVWAWIIQRENARQLGPVGRSNHSRCHDLQELEREPGGGSGDLMRHTPALIETMRIRNGLAPLWYLHIRRLATSCKALGIPLPGELPPPEGGLDRTVRWEVGMRGSRKASGWSSRLNRSSSSSPGSPTTRIPTRPLSGLSSTGRGIRPAGQRPMTRCCLLREVIWRRPRSGACSGGRVGHCAPRLWSSGSCPG